PTTAKTGATIMRIAVNDGSFKNIICGQNEYGEYEDYRIYIAPYLTLPVIELVGADTITIEQGTVYNDSGVIATSRLYGTITSSVIVTMPISGFNLVPGTYKIAYNVKDPANNEAKTVYRVVVVNKDLTAPILTVAKPDTITLQVGKTFTPPAVLVANDLVDGDVTGAVSIANGVNSAVIGFYTITYTVTDRSGNTTTQYRYVSVIDTIMPTLVLNGSANITLEVGTPYTDLDVTVKDNYYSEAELRKNLAIQSNVNENAVGTYTIVYTLTDPFTGKTISVSRTVEVKDTQKPIVTLVGDTAITLDVFQTLNDPGVKVTDNYDKNLTYKTSGNFYAAFPNGRATTLGSYQVIYTVTDASGNTSTITRTINVVDRIAPVLVLTGDPNVNICRWTTYNDLGVDVTDNYDKTSELVITQEGNFLTEGSKMEGIFNLRYKAVDKSGNVAYSDYRQINVRNPYEFPCATATSIGEQVSIEKLVKVYPNPNAGKFTVEANLPVNEQVRISVTNLLGQEVTVISNGALDKNTFSVDLSNQNAGVYMLTISTAKQTVTKRVVIT
ncbi:MAG: DUF5011 domain-containing protein, partial [Sphingobacteriales bacterium]